MSEGQHDATLHESNHKSDTLLTVQKSKRKHYLYQKAPKIIPRKYQLGQRSSMEYYPPNLSGAHDDHHVVHAAIHGKTIDVSHIRERSRTVHQAKPSRSCAKLDRYCNA